MIKITIKHSRNSPEIDKTDIQFNTQSKIDGFGLSTPDNTIGPAGDPFRASSALPRHAMEEESKHSSIPGDNELGYLFKDCHKIPMIKCGTEVSELSNFLDTSFEHRNIFFIKYKDE